MKKLFAIIFLLTASICVAQRPVQGSIIPVSSDPTGVACTSGVPMEYYTGTYYGCDNTGHIAKVTSGTSNITLTSTSVTSLGLLADYWFDEGSGKEIINHAFPQYVVPNFLGCYISPAACYGTVNGGGTWTAAYAADSPYGPTYNSDRLQLNAGNAYTNPSVVPTVTAGSYVMSAWVKATSGTQTFRLACGPSLTYSGTLTATSTWQQFSVICNVATNGSLTYAIFSTDGTNASDLLTFAPRVDAGSTPLAFTRRQLDLVNGPNGGTANTPTWTAYGVNTAGGSYWLTATGSQSLTLKAGTIYALIRSTGTDVLSGYEPIVSNVSNLDPGNFALAGNEAALGPRFVFSTTNTSSRATKIADTNWHFLAGTYDGTLLNLYVDGSLVGETTTGGLSTNLTNIFVSLDNGVAFWPGDIVYVSVYEVAHTQAQILQKMTEVFSLVTPRGITPLNPRFVACEGDSITDQSTAVNGGYCVLGGLAGLSPVAVTSDWAISGSGITNMVSREATTSKAFVSTSPRNILTVLIGANDLLSYATPAAWYAALQSYIADMRAKTPGLKVVGATITPRTATGFNTARATANSLIKSGDGTFDAVADFAADPTCGPDAAASNTSYYSDGTHPTATCQAIFQPIWTAAVQSVE